MADKIEHKLHGTILDEPPFGKGKRRNGYYVIQNNSDKKEKYLIKGKYKAGEKINFHPTDQSVQNSTKKLAKEVLVDHPNTHASLQKFGEFAPHSVDLLHDYKERKYFCARISTIAKKGHYGLLKLHNGKYILYLSNKKYELNQKVYYHIIQTKVFKNVPKLCLGVNLTSKKPKSFELINDCGIEFLEHIGKHGTVIDEEPDFNNYKKLKETNTGVLYAFQGNIPKNSPVGFYEAAGWYNGYPKAYIIHKGS